MRRWSRVAAFSLVCTVLAMPAMAQDTLSVIPTDAEPVEEPGLTGFGIIDVYISKEFPGTVDLEPCLPLRVDDIIVTTANVCSFALTASQTIAVQ